VVLLEAGLLGKVLGGQAVQHPTFSQPIGQSIGGNWNDTPESDPVDNEKLLRALNADRQKSMVSDTDKLLRLVDHLNAEIAHSQPDALTPGELREVAQIEKLAHNVKDKMSTSVRGTAPFRPPPMSRR
jgi:hypothetical protein